MGGKVRIKATWIIPGLLVTLLLSLLWALPGMAAPSGEETGEALILDAAGGDEISYASTYEAGYTHATGTFPTIYLQVTDDDLNVPTKKTVAGAGTNKAHAAVAFNDNTTTVIDVSDLYDLADQDGDGHIDKRDIDILTTADAAFTSTTTFTVDLLNGQMSVKVTGHGSNITGVHLAYWVNAASTEGTTNVATSSVTVTSDATPAGIGVVTTETGIDTGIFGEVIAICDVTEYNCTTNAASNPPILAVNGTGDTVVLEYEDADPEGTRSAELTIETDIPEFSNPSPADGSAGTDDDPDFFIDVTDAESEIEDDDEADATLTFVFAAVDEDGNVVDDEIDTVYSVSRSNFDDETAIGDGFQFEATFTSGDDIEVPVATTEYEIHWWVIATDQAGNVGVTDNEEADDLTGTVAIAENSTGITGTGTDFDGEMAVGSTITVAGETRIIAAIASDTAATANAIFNETRTGQAATTGDCIGYSFNKTLTSLTHMAGCDPYIVRVDEEAPAITSATTGNNLNDDDEVESGSDAIRTSIQVVFNEELDCDTVDASDFEVDDAEPVGVTCDEDAATSVFLEVAELDSDEEPEIELVGAVTDLAGNELDDDDVTASDGIPAALTVTVAGVTSGDQPATDDTVTITITSDERLQTRPNVEINQIHDDELATGGTDVAGDGAPTGTTNEWTFEASIGDAGLYNVYVTGDDLGGNIETEHGVDPSDWDADSMDDDSPTLFEVDTGLPAPTFTPADEGETDDPSSFLKISFDNEGKEYGLEADDDFTEVSANVDDDFDSQNTVTLTEVIIDGPGYDEDDVTDKFSSRDDILFLWRPMDLEEGTYTLDVTAEDAVGNEGEFSIEFDVVAREPYEIPLDAGANLVSFPAVPTDSSIDDVLGGEDAITLVMTYDNAAGLWHVASRGDDGGSFTGNLTSIDSRHAYWIVSSETLDLEVLLDASEGGVPTLPPAIEVYEGWNLVPVVDVDQGDVSTTIDADVYLANIDWDIAYGFDTINGTFDKIQDGGSDDLNNGSGYFVYANDEGVIIP